MLLSIFRLIESTIVKTEIIAKIPMVIPKSDRKVRSLFSVNEPIANLKLSLTKLKNISAKCNTFGRF
jgi:hypothetical protein